MRDQEKINEMTDIYSRLDETLEDQEYSNLDGDQFIQQVLD